MRTITISTFLLECLLISACGSGGSGGEASGTFTTNLPDPLPNTPATFQAVRDASPMKSCPHSEYYLATENTGWKLSDDYGFAVHDVLMISEDCTFRTANCGALGYIVSGGKSDGSGILDIIILGYLNPQSYCLQLGANTCSYTIDGLDKLILKCQLVTPLATPFIP